MMKEVLFSPRQLQPFPRSGGPLERLVQQTGSSRQSKSSRGAQGIGMCCCKRST
jgi:hypothetical protein